MSRLLLALAVGAAVLGGCAADAKTSAREPATTSTTVVLPDGACLARMSDPNPGRGGSDTVIVDSHFPSTGVAVAVHYKSTVSNYSGQLDGKGHGELPFSIGSPTANFAVQVEVDVNGQEKCTTTFTPH
jgi:hypothetical protein